MNEREYQLGLFIDRNLKRGASCKVMQEIFEQAWDTNLDLDDVLTLADVNLKWYLKGQQDKLNRGYN